MMRNVSVSVANGIIPHLASLAVATWEVCVDGCHCLCFRLDVGFLKAAATLESYILCLILLTTIVRMGWHPKPILGVE